LWIISGLRAIRGEARVPAYDSHSIGVDSQMIFYNAALAHADCP
jgi:hypothetical protein